jgi:TRAP-type C4-dicarboxylate transport system permease small subunit
LRKLLGTLAGLVAALALFGIMVLTAVDVSGRKFLSASVPGSLELTELPLVSRHGEHVIFDSLDRWLPRGVQRAQQALVDLLCAALLAGLAWIMWSKGVQMAEYGETTAQLKLPVYPFVWLMSVLCALTAAVHLLLVARPVAHHHAGVHDEEPGAVR